MKKILKNKKTLICIVTVLILIGLILGGIFLFGKDKEEKTQNNETTNNYVAYIRINPLIKIEYSQTCKNEICNDPIVTKYELINEDAKNIYKDIDLLASDKDLIKVVNLICETARENDIVFDTINIYSDWNKIETYLEEGTELTETVTFNIEITNKNDIEDIIKTDNNEVIKYTISFDTNGGSKIDSQEVIKEEKIIKPTNPTRKGYKFVEWQLDGKTFDFDTVITKNITLKAIWEKEATQNNSSSNNTNNNNTNNQNNNNSNSNNQSNNTNNNTNNNSNNNQNTNEPTNTPPSEEDAHKGIINLNDNVTYITGTIAYSCDNCISDSVIQKINSYKGITNNGLTSSVAIIKSINIPEGKYSDYDGVNIGVVEDLLIQCGAEMGGGDSDPEPKLLTEQICSEYKLSCDRW